MSVWSFVFAVVAAYFIIILIKSLVAGLAAGIRKAREIRNERK